MNQIDKKIWGPIIWNIIHIISITYKNDKQTDLFITIYKKFILSIIPCNKCINDYANYINNITFSPKDLEYKLYDFHNNVSKRINNKTITCKNCNNKKYSNLCCSNIFKLLQQLKDYYRNSDDINEFIKFLNNNKDMIFHQ